MAAAHDVLTTDEYQDKKTGETKTKWLRVGVAWPSRNGDGFDIRLNALPTNAKLFVRPKREPGQRSESSSDTGGESIPF